MSLECLSKEPLLNFHCSNFNPTSLYRIQKMECDSMSKSLYSPTECIYNKHWMMKYAIIHDDKKKPSLWRMSIDLALW